MAELKKQKITCPKCKREVDINVWTKIELPYDAEQREQVLRNMLFKVGCETCKETFTIAYKCQYNDMERRFLLWVAPAMDEKTQNEIAAYNHRLTVDNTLRLAQGGYRYRIVRSDNELREKVIIFEDGLDDRFVETMKIVYVPIIKNRVGINVPITGIYFDRKRSGGYQFIVTFVDRQPMCADANMEIYADMTEKLRAIVERETPSGLCRIDADWALKVMMNKVE